MNDAFSASTEILPFAEQLFEMAKTEDQHHPSNLPGEPDTWTQTRTSAALYDAAFTVQNLVDALRNLMTGLDGACGSVIPEGSFSVQRKAARAAIARAEQLHDGHQTQDQIVKEFFADLGLTEKVTP